MLEWAHLFHLISLIVGIIAIYVVFNLRKEINYKYILPYILILICINLISAAHSYESFIKVKSSLAVNTINLKSQLNISFIVLSAIRLILAYQFLYFTWLLTNNPWKKITHYLFIAFIFMASSIQILAYLYPSYFIDSYIIQTKSYYHFILFAAFILGVIKIKIHSLKLSNKIIKNWFLYFSFFWLMYSLLIFMNRIIGQTSLIDLNTQLLNFGIITLLLNVIHIVFINSFVNNYRKMPKENDEAFNSLIEKYKITNREAEIIGYICEGKTNKEIGEILFIAPNTVRDHTSNILRKTKQKNRTQLASLFKILTD